MVTPTRAVRPKPVPTENQTLKNLACLCPKRNRGSFKTDIFKSQYQQEMVLETWVTRKGNTVCVCAVRHLLIRLPTMIFLTQLSSSRLCLQF